MYHRVLQLQLHSVDLDHCAGAVVAFNEHHALLDDSLCWGCN